MASEGNERAEMRAHPTFSQKRAFEDWVSEIDTWPLSEVLDKMIDMLEKPDQPTGREAWI